MTEVAPTSLRERKKAHTRRRLIEASQELFRTHGFAATTLEQVAAEVDVHVKTLLRYFPTKQDLALALEHQVYERWRRGLQDPERTQPCIEHYCEFIRDLAAEWISDERRADRLAYVLLLDSEPTVAAAALQLTQRYEDDVAAAFATEMGITAGFDMYAQVVAAMLVNTMNALARRWASDPSAIDLLAAIDATRDFCLLEFPSRAGAPSLVDRSLTTGRRVG